MGSMSAQSPEMMPNRPAAPKKVSSGWLGVLLVLLAVCFCVLTGSTSLTMRQQIYENATRSSQNLLQAEIAGIDRILTIYDASLRSASATFRNPVLRGASPELQRLAIFDGIQDTPELGPVRILAADGRVLYDSATTLPAAASPAELAAVALHRLSPASDARISHPFAIGRGSFAITLSHRVSTPDGAFGGIVVGTIDLDLFQQQFARLDVGANDSVSLFSDDGVMLAHIPGKPLVGRSIAGSALLKQFRSGAAGTIVAPAAIDGVKRVFSFKHIAPWPLFLDVGVATQDLYRPWLFRTVITVCLMVALIIFTVLLLRLLRRDLEARHQAEENLAASERRYRMLAESASDVIVRVDRQTIRTYVSPSVTQYGYEPEDLVGLTSGSWVHEDDLIATREIFFRTIDEQVDTVVQYRLQTKAGTYTRVEAFLSPIRQGGYLAVVRNIENRTPEERDRAAATGAPTQSAAADDLTKLATRHAFDEALPEAWRDAIASGQPLSLVLIDIDHFRSYFERYGDRSGDDVLIDVAQLCDVGARKGGGVASRYGDDAFAVILPNADLGTAIAVAHAIRTAVWDESLDHAGSPSGRVTISVGAATFMTGVVTGSPEALVRAAEDALARVKQGDRNQVQALALA